MTGRNWIVRGSTLYRWLAVSVVLVASATAQAQDLTVKRSLSDLGYPEGLTLQHREAAEFVIDAPRDTLLSKGTVRLEGRELAPMMARGSLVLRHNSQPIGATSIEKSENPTPFVLEVPLEFPVNSGDGIRIRVNAELVAEGAACPAQGSPANSIFLSPESYVSYQVDPSDIDTIAEALSLLPRRVPIVVPPELPDALAAAGIQLGSMLRERGYETVYQRGSPPGGAYFALQAQGEGIRLNSSGRGLEIEFSAQADLGAFQRIWSLAPSAVGSNLKFDDTPVPLARPRDDGFAPFDDLPPLRMTGAYGTLTTKFDYLGMSGRRPRELLLDLATAPDWSGQDPIVSILLNGQLIHVVRPDAGREQLRVTLPPELLTFRNTLTLQIGRAVADTNCEKNNAGFPVQLTRGSGVIYGAADEKGFAEFARSAQAHVVIVLPDDKHAVLDGIAFSANVLAGLGLGGTNVRVQQALADGYEGAAIRITGVDSGLHLPREYASDRSMRFSTDRPLARLDVAESRPVLNIVYVNDQGIPAPKTFFLGTGTVALVGNAGILWQNAGELERLSLGQRTLNSVNDLLVWLRNEGAWIWLVIFGGLALLLIVRIIIGRAARRSRH